MSNIVVIVFDTPRPNAIASQALYYQQADFNSGPLPTQPETQPHFVGRFTPTRHTLLSALWQNSENVTSAPTPQPSTEPHFIGRFTPTRHQLLNSLWQNSENVASGPLTPVSDANAHIEVVVFATPVPNLAAARALYYSQTVDAQSVLQPSTEPHFIGRFTPTLYTVLPLLRQNVESSINGPQASTEPHFLARFTPTRHQLLQLLRQNPDTSISGPLPPQPSTEPHFLARFVPTRHQVLPLLRQLGALDVPAVIQPSTEPHFLARFTPTRHVLLQLLRQNSENVASGPVHTFETPPHFVARFTPTRHLVLQLLRQNSENVANGPVLTGPNPITTGFYSPAPLQGAGNLPNWITAIAQVTNNNLAGKLNVHLDVTLNANATTTVIQDPRIGDSTVITAAMPLTADGLTALLAGIRVTGQLPAVGSTPGQAIINHANSAATDQQIRFLLIG